MTLMHLTIGLPWTVVIELKERDGRKKSLSQFFRPSLSD